MRWRFDRLTAVVAAVLAAACASPPVPTGAPAPAAPPLPAVDAPAPTRAPDPWLVSVERRQVERATRAESQGHWAAAVLEWEVLTLVNPDDPSHQARWVEARRQADRVAAERQALAEAAQRRGDLDAASRAWLEVLAIDPGRAQAAAALRQIERERHRRATVGRFAANAATRRVGVEAPMGDAGEPGRSASNVREHASMLAKQGDIDGAIQLLKDAPQARSDGGLRGLMADLYVHKAESLKHRQPAAARAALEAALALERRHPGALALQAQLPPPRSRAVPATGTGR